MFVPASVYVYSTLPAELSSESPVPNRKLKLTALLADAVNLTTPEPSPLGLLESKPTISTDNVKLEGVILSGSLVSVASSVDSPEHDKTRNTNKIKLDKLCFNR